MPKLALEKSQFKSGAGAALLYVGATLLLACTANEVAQITFGRDILHTTAYDRCASICAYMEIIDQSVFRL